MIFEFSNDLVPILLSVSMYLTVIAAHLFNGMTKEFVIKRRYLANEHIQSVRLSATSDNLLINDFVEKQSFITRIVKRKESPEDDADYCFSSTKTMNTKRGGQQWKTQIDLYLASLKGTVFSY